MQYSQVSLSRIEVSPRSRSLLRRLKTLPAAGRRVAPCAAPSSVSPIPHRSRCPRPRCRLPVIRSTFLFQISDITHADSCDQPCSAAPPRRCRHHRCSPPATTSATPNLSRTPSRGDRLARGIAVLVFAPPDEACPGSPGCVFDRYRPAGPAGYLNLSQEICNLVSAPTWAPGNSFPLLAPALTSRLLVPTCCTSGLL